MTFDIKKNRDEYWKQLLQDPLFDDGFFNRDYMKTDSSYKSLALYSRRKSDSLFNFKELSLNFKFDARRVGDVSSKSYLSVELTLHSKNDDKIPVYNHLEQRK